MSETKQRLCVRSIQAGALLSALLLLTAGSVWAKGKPGGSGGGGKCENIAATWEFANGTIPAGGQSYGLQSSVPGQTYDAAIQVCSGSTDSTMSTSGNSTIFIALGTEIDGGQGAPGWVDGDHSVFINIRKLLYNPADSTEYLTLAELPESSYSFTTVMVVRPDSYDEYPIWFFNSGADTYGHTNQNEPDDVTNSDPPTSEVNVTYDPPAVVGDPHTWTVGPVSAVAMQTYQEGNGRKVVEYSAGLYSVPFLLTITAYE